MTDPATNLRIAEAQAVQARARLTSTIGRLQERLDPKLLTKQAKQVGTAAALAGVEQAKRNPAAAAGAAAVGLLFLSRHRIAGFFRRRKARKPLPAQARAPASTDAGPPPQTQKD